MHPDDSRHGTVNGYSNHGCRCQKCRDAWTPAVLELRHARAAKITPDDPRHGTYNFYVNHRCRCELCREANRLAAAERKARNSVTS